MNRRLLVFPLLAATAAANIVNDVRDAIGRKDFPSAEAQIQVYQKQHGATPEVTEALSWLGRGALAAGRLDAANAYASKTFDLCQAALKSRKLDAEPQLPIALGAAIEVHAQVMARRGHRGEALAYLRQELAAYRTTSIATRIGKNINLLSLEGKPAPVLDLRHYIGVKPPALAELKGRPALVFFWAHWCGDCRAEAPLLAQIKQEFSAKHLVLIGPTRLYGYAARGEDATPDQELAYIDQVRRKFYSSLLDVPVPVSESNFVKYGASTTPTIVLLDRQGIVRLYHPGAMTAEELRAAVRRVTG